MENVYKTGVLDIPNIKSERADALSLFMVEV
jgi:hypothetical protein